MLDKYYNQEVINNNEYKFTSFPEYYSPCFLDSDSFIEFIRNIPLFTSPEAFGLNENAKITRDYRETQHLFDTILLKYFISI